MEFPLSFHNGKVNPLRPMKFSHAFRATLDRYQIKGTDIAEATGLTPAQVSNFRNGKNLRIDTVERILAALKPEERRYLLDLVFDNPLADGYPPNRNLRGQGERSPKKNTPLR